MVDVDMLITVLTAVLTTCVVASLLRGLHETNAARTEIEAAAAEAVDEVEGDEGIEEDSTDVSSKSETETETETETEGTASTGDSPKGVSLLPPDTDSDATDTDTDTGDQADDEADAAKDKDCFSATPTEM
jgi:cytoskeletal protein RodZ